MIHPGSSFWQRNLTRASLIRPYTLCQCRSLARNLGHGPATPHPAGGARSVEKEVAGHVVLCRNPTMALFERKASERVLENVHTFAKKGLITKIKEYQRRQQQNGVASSRALSELDHVMQATPLHFAAEHGHADVVSHLLDEGVPVELKDRAGCGPLHYAAGKGWATAVKLLVGHGASTQARDLKGDTPLHWAASNRGPGPNSEWDGGDDDERERPDHTETIRLLVKLGQGIDAVNEEGWTPLHRAAYNGRVATIQTLCEMGASVNAANQAGDTPLHLAALSGQIDAVEALIRYGARTTMLNSAGKTPADLTGNEGLRELIESTDEFRRMSALPVRGLMNKNMSGMDSIDPATAKALQESALEELAKQSAKAGPSRLGVASMGLGRVPGPEDSPTDADAVSSMLRKQFSRQASLRTAADSLAGMDLMGSGSDDGDESTSGRGSRRTSLQGTGPGSRSGPGRRPMVSSSGSRPAAISEEAGDRPGSNDQPVDSEALSGWGAGMQDYQDAKRAQNREERARGTALGKQPSGRTQVGPNQAFLKKYDLNNKGLFAS